MNSSSAPRGEQAEARDRVALAEVIDRCKDDIVARWAERIRAEAPPNVGPAELRDAMPDYLKELANALRSCDSLEQRGTSAWESVAREHALARVRLGFDIDKLVHEFIVLRQVLSATSREQKLALNVSQAERVADLVDGAISSAVRSYIDARDYSARQKEAEHVSFITHELRNPLSAVKLAVARLRRSAQQAQTHLLDVVERNVRRLEALIDGVLDVERMQAGKVEAHVAPVELGELLGRVLVTAKMHAEAKGLTLMADYDPHLLVEADRDLAASAIANVVDNAVKYTDVGEIHVTAEEDVDRVLVHVKDDCPGLSQAELRVVFEPFERGGSNKPGTGLGLAIARRALEAQGGSIGAESPGEHGCHFWMALRRAGH